MPRIMGILNVTPDSFSDGGVYLNSDKAVERALQMVDEGADIIDIGGESTRPGSDPVSLDAELPRVLPVIQTLRSKTKIPISIDTQKSIVAAQAIEAGATMINDVSAARADPEMVAVLKKSLVPFVIMHMRGNPKTMQSNVQYGNVVEELMHFFQERIDALEKEGVSRSRLIVDPGIGFGKNFEHNLVILKQLKRFKEFDCPLMVGASRKAFLGTISKRDAANDRLHESTALACYSALNGVDILRVHDVAETKRALDVIKAISASE